MDLLLNNNDMCILLIYFETEWKHMNALATSQGVESGVRSVRDCLSHGLI